MAWNRDVIRQRISLMAGFLTLVLLIVLTVVSPPNQADLAPALLFGALIVFSMTFGIRIGAGEVSLMPMMIVAGYLVIGLVLAGWVTFVSALIHGGIRYRWLRRLTDQREPGELGHAARAATNATMHTLSILAGGAAYQGTGGVTPLTIIDASTFLSLMLLGVTTLGVNYLIAGVYIAALGKAALRTFLLSLHRIALYEGGLMVFSPLMALTYTQLGTGYFLLFALSFVAGSLIAHNLDVANRRLGQRVKELDSLQAVGQTLSASLDTDTIVSAIYDQVVGLMPASGFYVALYDSQMEEVSFPLVIEGEPVHWRSRRAGQGLTEYVLRTKGPLLIREDVGQKATELGVDRLEREAACWLGVPMLAGTEPLGVIAVQSYTTPRAYTRSHQRVLLTIAAQAAVAIQNARLYARTDQSLAQRVQQLDSILRTSHDGYLLLDVEWRVLTINRTLAGWVSVAQSELIGQALDTPLSGGETLARLIGYPPNVLRKDCRALGEGRVDQKQAVVLLGPSMRHIERTLIPVRDRDGAISGWLLAFRDMTEEIELARLRDDMTDMLVHDLRSPLTAVMGGLALMKSSFDERDEATFEQLRAMAQHGSDRILTIVNQLLDISKLESGQLPLQLEILDVEALLHETKARYNALAAEAQIELSVETPAGLPSLQADPALLSRVMDNLLDNAIKFTPDEGQIQLWARWDAKADPEMILLGVSDTGPGIPSESQPRLFYKFEQVATTEGRRKGTGLGLAFCKLAVEAHGGQIGVESEFGVGSTFILTLPVTQEHIQEP